MTATLFVVNLLYKIAPAHTIKHKATGSRSELLETFTTYVATEADVAVTVESKCKEGVPFQSRIIVVGEPYVTCNVVFFYLTKNVFWRFDHISYPEAIDRIFKIFHAVAGSYPRDCEQTWTFFQIAFYSMKTNYDNVTVSLRTLINDLGVSDRL